MWGAAGLALSSGLAGWAEMSMLRRTLNSRIGHTGLPLNYIVKLWSAATAAAMVAWPVKLALPPMHPAIEGIVILGSYGLVFLVMAFLTRIPEAATVVARFRRRF